MARVPPLRRFSLEDYSTQATWISPLLQNLNTFFEQTVASLNKGLTIADNLSGTIQTFTYTGTLPVYLSWSLKSKPVSVQVVNVVRTDGTAYTQVDPVQVQWTFNNASQLEIDTIMGLLPKAKKCAAADIVSSVLTIPVHEFVQGQKVVPTSTGVLSTGLTAGTPVYVIYVDANSVKLASSDTNAAAKTALTLSGSPTGYTILTPQLTNNFDITIECKTG